MGPGGAIKWSGPPKGLVTPPQNSKVCSSRLKELLAGGKFVMSCKHKLQPGITGGSCGLSARPVCNGVCTVMTRLKSLYLHFNYFYTTANAASNALWFYGILFCSMRVTHLVRLIIHFESTSSTRVPNQLDHALPRKKLSCWFDCLDVEKC